MTRPRTVTKYSKPPLSDAVPLLAGFDTITYSSQARISSAVRGRLEEDKAAAQVAARVGAVHCPDWLGAPARRPGCEVGEEALQYRASHEPHERSWRQILWLLAKGQTAAAED